MAEDIILLAHGGGGSLTRSLIDRVLLKHLRNPILETLDDAVCLHMESEHVVFTTDSYVVNPLFFPGGDIGKLAVCGTVNDLAMQGARPRYLSLGLILEEGLPVADLDRIVASLAAVSKALGVPVVTGDTKVVERGRGSGVYINTAGIGVRAPEIDVHVANARPGDVVIVTGTVADHGIAVLSRREGLAFESEIESDVAPLSPMTERLLAAVPEIRCLRDPTRGGLTAALCDIAEASGAGIRVVERDIPVRRDVRGACELLGLDPLVVANEGKAVVVCPEDRADEALAVLRSDPLGANAAAIGRVTEDAAGLVVLETLIGGRRVLEVPSGEALPRIC